MRGVPFSFVRVDRAGNMSKRQSATGFHFSSSGGTCPLWNVYETFANPGKILVQIAQMPDGRNYMWVARTIERRASRYGQPGKTFAIGLGCELRHAHRLVYSEGLDLSGDSRHTDRRGLPGLRTRQLPAARIPRLGSRTRSRRTPQHGVALPGEAGMTDRTGQPARIPARQLPRAGADQLGDLPSSAARTASGPRRCTCSPRWASTKRLFWRWMPFSACLLLRGRLPRKDAELVILRVAHLRDCEYELQHHRRMARTPRSRTPTCRPRSSPGRPGRRRALTDRQQALLTATDEFILNRAMSAETWTDAVGAPRPAPAHRILHCSQGNTMRWPRRCRR